MKPLKLINLCRFTITKNTNIDARMMCEDIFARFENLNKIGGKNANT